MSATLTPVTDQLQPFAAAEQLAAEAVKVMDWLGCPDTGPATLIEGGDGLATTMFGWVLSFDSLPRVIVSVGVNVLTVL